MTFGKVTIIGVGLIGGSIGLDLIELGLADHVTGCGHRQASIDRAMELGVVQAATLDPVASVDGADLVILATPVPLVPEMFRTVAPHLKQGCVVTDVASVKSWIAGEVAKVLPPGVSFVPAHPIAGSEKRSVEFARHGLFRKALCIITPLSRQASAAEELVSRFWKSLGARVEQMSPEEHDKVFSLVSHLPHAVASCLIESVSDEALSYGGKGLKDTTRIAAGDARLWADIFLSNRAEVLNSLQSFAEALEKFKEALTNRDSDALTSLLEAAKRKREAL